MKKLTTEQRLEGYLDFEKEGLGPPNLMSFLRGIAFAEEHYLEKEHVGNSDKLEQAVVSSKMEHTFIRLTRDEIRKAWAQCDDVVIFVREIERLLEEKNK